MTEFTTEQLVQIDALVQLRMKALVDEFKSIVGDWIDWTETAIANQAHGTELALWAVQGYKGDRPRRHQTRAEKERTERLIERLTSGTPTGNGPKRPPFPHETNPDE